MSNIILPLLLLCVVASAIYFFAQPPKLPLGIPSIPFYVTFIPLFKDVDQEQIYQTYMKRPLQDHGMVKIFFGGRWNLLVQRPEFVAEIFKLEDIFQKSGNQKKIPYSVLAEYTGDNIISGHGENWRLYQSVIKPGLQRSFEVETIRENGEKLYGLIVDRQESCGTGRGISVLDLFQRYALANLSQVVLGCDFRTMEDENAPIARLQMQLKPMIFNPTFLNFPFLDKFPVPSRVIARRLVQDFTNELTQIIIRSQEGKACSLESISLGERLVAARNQGLLSEAQFRHNCISVFLAGHENPQLLFTSLMYLLGKHPDFQEQLRVEVQSVSCLESPETALQQLPFLTAVTLETLRMYPPISQLINRRTSVATTLGSKGDIHVPAGTYLGYNAYSTSRDRLAWGSDANDFRPGRWGDTLDAINKKYRKASARAEFITFHGGRRACLGERFAMLETKTTVAILLGKLRWTIDPTWEERMTPAGPLYARGLKLVFEPLAERCKEG